MLALGILLIAFAAAIFFEATTQGLSTGNRGVGRLFSSLNALFGEFVARYFVGLPFAAAGVAFVSAALKSSTEDRKRG